MTVWLEKREVFVILWKIPLGFFFCNFFDTHADVAGEFHSAALEPLIKRRRKPYIVTLGW